MDAADTEQTGPGRWIALAAIWLVYTAFGSTAASLAPILPEIRDELGVDNTTMGAILGAWTLVYVAAAIPAGVLLDAIGTRLGVFAAALIIAASAYLRGVATTPETLLLAVGLFGLGGPLISIGAPKLIAQLFPSRSRGTAIGIYMTGPNLGAILSLTLTNDFLIPLVGSWRGVMVFHAGFALAAGLIWLAAMALARLKDDTIERHPFDRQALFSLLRHREVITVLVMALGVFFINHAMNNWLAALLRAKGMEAAAAGYWSAIPTLVGMVAALTVPRFATEPRRLKILMAIYAAAAVASILIAVGSGAGLAAGLILQGVVRGSMMSITVLVMVELSAIPKSRAGLAGGLFFTAGEIGGVLGPLTIGSLRDLSGSFVMPFFSLTVMALVLMALTFSLGRTMRRN